MPLKIISRSPAAEVDADPERMKRTRLQELDLKAKSILEAWSTQATDASEGYGPQQQKEAGLFSSGDDYRWTQSYYRDTTSADDNERGSAERVNHQSNYTEQWATNDKHRALHRKIGSVLYWSQHGSQWHGGPIPPDRVSDYNYNKPFHKFGNQNHKRPSEREDRNAAVGAYRTGGWDAFYAKADEISARKSRQVGPPTIEEKWATTTAEGGPAAEAKGGGSSRHQVRANSARSHFPYKGEETGGALSVKFGDVNAFVPDSPENRDLFEGFKKAYQTGKNVTFENESGGESLSMLDIFFRLSDSARMTKYGAGTIRELYDAEFADGKAPTVQATKILRKNQWSQEDMNAQYDEGREYVFTDSYYRYDYDNTPNLEFGDADDPVTRGNHQSFTLSRPDEKTIELKRNIQRATVRNPEGDQWPNRSANGKSIFNRNEQYDQRFKKSDTVSYRGQIYQQDGTKIIYNMLGWPEVTGISPNIQPFGKNRYARNLEELWFSLVNIKTDGPASTQVQRSGADIRLSTFFSSDRISNLDYKVRFLSALDGSFANVPDSRQVSYQGARGFNVGQVEPYNKNTGDYQFGDAREMDIYDSGRLHRILSNINGYEQELMEIKPGGNRINIVFNIRVNLSKLLQQNLLMPTDLYPANASNYNQTLDLATAIEEGVSSHINDDTFTKLYLENRSALHSTESGQFKRNPPGTIAGVPIADLQGPVTPQTGVGGQYDAGDADDGSPVFRIEDEDGPTGRNNTITKDRGFIDNIPGQVHGNISSPGGLMPAVENDGANVGAETLDFPDQTTFTKTRWRANEQFFPFMFETINKKGSALMGQEYKQYAYFQATLQSLTESYAPAWSSKHFFGRTEQIHTYTMTERTIDLSFVIFATEIRRLQNLYERVTWLAQQAYPSYDSNNRLKAGPLIKMTIGDMFSGLNGFIRSLSFDWNHLGPGGKWEITQGLRIPMSCTVTMNFTVMHDDMPDRNYAFYPGPLRGGKGLIGDRGISKDHPEGGPLISTAARAKRSGEVFDELWADGMMSRYQLQQAANAAGLSVDSLVNKMRAAESGGGGRTQQYIDWINTNSSIGKNDKDYINSAGEKDLVFT